MEALARKQIGWYSTKEVEAMLSLDARSLHKLAAAGHLRCVKYGQGRRSRYRWTVKEVNRLATNPPEVLPI